MNRYLEKVAANWEKIESRLMDRYLKESASNEMVKKNPWLVPARIRSNAKHGAESAAMEANSMREAVKEHTRLPYPESMKGNDIAKARLDKAFSSRIKSDQAVLDARASKLSRAHDRIDEITERWREGGYPKPKPRLRVVK